MDSVLELLSDYTTEVVTATVLGVVFFLLLRRYLAARRARQWTTAPPAAVTFTPSAVETRTAQNRTQTRQAAPGEPHEMVILEAKPTPPEGLPARTQTAQFNTKPPTPTALTTTASLKLNLPAERPTNVANFGAYRIEQEVNKLAAGQPHRIEVLASRSPDDRRAIESSLLRLLASAQADDPARERIRRALEDYGFVARRCAELLLANDVEDRTTAAQLLGEVGSGTALPFLLEALYDHEEGVRLQAVVGLGALRLPAAIGALLDLARRHPELPSTILSNALNACSVESLSFFDVPDLGEPTPLLLAGADEFFDDDDLFGDAEDADFAFTAQADDILSDLPPGDEDESVLEILRHLEKADLERRAELYRALGHRRTRLSLLTLSEAATHDNEPFLRAAAVSGLCDLDHPAGFAPVLLAVGDESREVRAAAARSFSRLSFERSEAYVHLTQSESPERLLAIAQACIKAGMAAQALDRLVSEDQRQSYESFTLLSLLAHAGEINPLLEAVGSHRSQDVRLAALRLLSNTSDPRIVAYLRQLAVSDGILENMRTALLEAIYKIEDAERRTQSISANDNWAARVA
jgi:HEAT repeat protein